ncbi:MAG: 4Fe-4S double cluster binding domain-containing protein [Candidatus Bathyarchaeota archaeon]
MGSLKAEIREMALEAGFNSVGFTTPEKVDGLRYGWVFDVRELKRPREFMPDARSVIMLTLHVWDPTFMMQISSPEWKGYMFHGPDEKIEGYYIAYQVSMAKAMPIVSRLMELGYKAQFNTAIPMKTTAVVCGLGCQGKNTLLVTPEVGPRVGLMAVLTSAELEPDQPFKGDFCEGCDRCIKACPTGALTPYKIDHMKCLTYASENPGRTDFAPEIREKERRLVTRPTLRSYVECSVCMYACPVGKRK